VPWLIFGWLLMCWTVSSVAICFICPHALGVATQALEEKPGETLVVGILAVLGMGLFLWAGVMLSVVLIGLPMVAIGTLLFFAVRSLGLAACFVSLGGLFGRRLLPWGLPRLLAMLLGIVAVALAHVHTSAKVILSVWLLTSIPAFGAAAMYWRRRRQVAGVAP
jgi:hypothetical protein